MFNNFGKYEKFYSLQNYKTQLAELSDTYSNENFHEIIIIGYLNADLSRGKFFRDFF